MKCPSILFVLYTVCPVYCLSSLLFVPIYPLSRIPCVPLLFVPLAFVRILFVHISFVPVPSFHTFIVLLLLKVWDIRFASLLFRKLGLNSQ